MRPHPSLAALALALVLLAPGAHAQAPDDRPSGFPARCAPGEVQVMLLGTYHFANPGADDVRQQVDDVLAPRRQAEIEDLVGRLARWAPDQIAVEWPASFADSTAARYAKYRAGTLAPDPNEVVQVGFRLARRLGHAGVHPIDARVGLSNDSLAPLAARRPDLLRARDSLLALSQAAADAEAVWMRGTSIVEHLRVGNGDAELHAGNSLVMFGSYLPAGDGDNYAGPQFLARWYERNLRMVHNLLRALRPGTDRVLVIVGAGHVPTMRSIMDESPHLCPVSPVPLLGRGEGKGERL